METITGTVQRVLWSSPEEGNHYKVFKLRRKGNQSDTITGEFEELIEGAEVEIHGDYSDHPKYGKGFRAKAHTFTFNRDSVHSISLYMQSIAKFLGPKRSYAIAHKFGSELESIIENEPERLLEVEDVGKKVIENLLEAWREHREEKSIRIFLHGLGLSAKNIKRILLSFGVESENKIRENPYLLAVVGFGFSTCDFIARKLELDPQSPIRLKYFIVWALKQSLSSGHLYLYDHQIIKIFNNYNEQTNYHFKNREIVQSDITEPLATLVDEGYIVQQDNRYYEVECFFFENESARLLSLIKGKEDLCMGFRDLDVEAFIVKFEEQERRNTGIADFALSDDQRDAIRSFVEDKILVVTGGPGSGKTTVIKAFVQLMLEHHVSFELLTPTGIAAKKLGNTAEYEAYTIHRRLGYKGDMWDYDAHQKYNTDVVVVDETSMVDMEVFYRLISALYTHTKIVLVGDNDQLPSVGPGRVLNEVIQSDSFKTIFLKNIFRQAAQSDIIKEARKIRNGDTDLSLLSQKKEDDIWFIRSQSDYWIEERIVEFARDLKKRIKEQGGKKTFQIITPRNSGPLSVETLNIAIQSALNPKREGEREVQLNNCVLRIGDRVLIKKNNYQLDVYNGDIGKITGLVQANIMIDIEDFSGSRQIAVPMEQAEDMLKLAYAITVHKCVPTSCRVFSDSGTKRIKNVAQGYSVMSHTFSPRNVEWAGDTGSKAIYKISTKHGFTTQGSKDHRYLVASEAGKSYKLLKQITTGDYLCLSMKPVEGCEIAISAPQSTPYRKAIKLPKYLTNKIAWLFGILISDGCYTDKEDGIVSLTKPSSPEILKGFREVIESIGLTVCEHKKKGEEYSLYISSKEFRDWFLSIGFSYSKAAEKTIPDIVFESTLSLRWSFITGLLDGDGCIDTRAFIRYTTASQKLAMDLQMLLLTVGVVSTVTKQSNLHYKISIGSLGYALVRKHVKLVNRAKMQRLSQYKAHGKTNLYEIPFGKKITEDFWEAFKKNEGPSQGKKGLGLYSKYPKVFSKCSNVRTGRNKLRIPDLDALKEVLDKEGITAPISLQDALNDFVFYDEFTSIEPMGAQETRDLTVSEDNSYISDGFLCHNSQGSEYDLVLLPIVKSHGKRILQRNLLYTALTRAKKKVIMFGQGAAVVDAIENDKIQERNTLLAERIQAWIKGKGTSLQQLYTNTADYQNASTLKRLLLSEEKASLEVVTTDSLSDVEQDSKEQTTEMSKPARRKKPFTSTSLEKILGEVEQLVEDSEAEESPKPRKTLRKRRMKKEESASL